MAERVEFQFIAEPDAALESVEQINEALESLQDTADKVSQSTTNLIPPDSVQASVTSLQNMQQGLTMASTGMRLVGVQGSMLIQVMRSLAYAQMSGAAAGKGLSAALHGVATSAYAVMTSIGPIGWAIMAIGAAVAVGTKLWNAKKKAMEEVTEALKNYNSASENFVSMEQRIEVEWLRATGREFEARKKMLEAARKAEYDSVIESWRERRNLSAKGIKDQEELEKVWRQIHRETFDAMYKIEEAYNIKLANLEEERLKSLESTVEEEIDLHLQRAEAMVSSLGEEFWALGKSRGAILERQLLLLGMSEEEAAATARLADRIELMKDEQRIAGAHESSMSELNHQYEMNNAILSGNIELQRELSILRRMDAGLTRDQAEAEVDKLQAIEAQQEAIREMNQETKEEIELQEELNRAQEVGLEQMYSKIAMAAASMESLADDIPELSGHTRTSESSSIANNQKSSVPVLEKIYDLMESIRNDLPLVGAMG